jgi:NAD+ synthase
MKEIKKNIISWIRKQIKDSKKNGVVLGLSGGLDSSVTAVLCRMALGKEKVLALILPCESQKKDIEDAKNLAKRFAIKTKLIDLTEIYNQLIKILPKANRLTYANLKARLRMIVLYYFANKLNYLVCGTSNESELMTGYFTKFGDGASDILPIGGLLKTEVRKLAEELNIPDFIIKKVPSAGLWEGQTDEKELGISYEELDKILNGLENKRRINIEREKIEKVKKMMKNSEHKRKGMVILKIKRR